MKREIVWGQRDQRCIDRIRQFELSWADYIKNIMDWEATKPHVRVEGFRSRDGAPNFHLVMRFVGIRVRGEDYEKYKELVLRYGVERLRSLGRDAAHALCSTSLNQTDRDRVFKRGEKFYELHNRQPSGSAVRSWAREINPDSVPRRFSPNERVRSVQEQLDQARKRVAELEQENAELRARNTELFAEMRKWKKAARSGRECVKSASLSV